VASVYKIRIDFTPRYYKVRCNQAKIVEKETLSLKINDTDYALQDIIRF
jgi:hypothetical protein